ncbi:MAG: dihydroorotate dehydrogenase [Planctomycetes bacterium]|nr:dihydroorotate dehydrogenase [Planctomycetota bacterium]
MADLTLQFAGLEWQSPLMSASGTFGHGTEMTGLVPFDSLGAWVSKTVTWEPRPGNPLPRIHETEAGFLNSIGLENRGIEHYIEHVVPALREAKAQDPKTRVITNLGGHTAEEFARLAERLSDEACIDAFELNLSCPNVDGGKLPYSTDPGRAEEVLSGARKVTKKPLFAKISPNVTRVDEIAKGCEAGGADGITAGNTLLGMGVNWRRRTPRLATTVGGYSGVGVKPVSLRCAYQVAQAVSIPVIGCGGIQTAEDVMEYIVAGCQAVQVGTVSFSDPSALSRMGQELQALLESEGIETLSDCVGSLRSHEAQPWRPS